MTPRIPSDPQRRYLKMDGWTLACTDVGSGPVLVAIHGHPGSVRDFRWLGPCLEPHARLIRLDLPGFGDSVYPSVRGQRVPQRADELIAALEALRVEGVTLIAHSMGGAVAVEVARRRPDLVARLALVAAVGPWAHYPQWVYRVLSAVLFVPGMVTLLEPLMRTLYKKLGFSSSLTVPEMVRVIHDAAVIDFDAHAANLHALQTPTMVAWADDDHLMKPALSRALAAAVPDGPRLHFATGGHNIQKTRAAELAEALLEWQRVIVFPRGGRAAGEA